MMELKRIDTKPDPIPDFTQDELDYYVEHIH